MSEFAQDIDGRTLYSTDQVRRQLRRMEEDETRFVGRKVTFLGNIGVIIEVRFSEITYWPHVRVAWSETKGYAPLGDPNRWFSTGGNMKFYEQ